MPELGSHFSFNPRTHTGCDQAPKDLQGGRYVSIHAPTRGATSPLPTSSISCFGFNPRTHTGCDKSSNPLVSVDTSFQSTHPHGVRLRTTGRVRASLTCFNPRTHTGCDSYHIRSSPYYALFQSTHPHGVRQKIRIKQKRGRTVSIHAPTRGATLFRSQIQCSSLFQSTHPHGVRRIRSAIKHRGVLVSIHAPTRGATLATYPLRGFSSGFNPRTHTGCDQTGMMIAKT